MGKTTVCPLWYVQLYLLEPGENLYVVVAEELQQVLRRRQLVTTEFNFLSKKVLYTVHTECFIYYRKYVL